MGRVTYLRLPHLKDDLLCFVAEDDLWLAPLDGPGRAWRLTVDRTKLGHPRFSPTAATSRTPAGAPWTRRCTWCRWTADPGGV